MSRASRIEKLEESIGSAAFKTQKQWASEYGWAKIYEWRKSRDHRFQASLEKLIGCQFPMPPGPTELEVQFWRDNALEFPISDAEDAENRRWLMEKLLS